MHHYKPSIIVFWIFIILAVLLVGVLLYFAPLIMKYLDDWSDRRKEKSSGKKQDKSEKQEKT